MKKLTTSLITLSLGLTLASNSFAIKMYWSDTIDHKIQRANLDGSSVEDLVSIPGNSDIYGIALDINNSKMYWADYGEDKIQRANLDGSNVEDLITVFDSIFNFDPLGIALDLTNSKIYWVNNGDKIMRANLDGSNAEDIVTGLSSGVVDINLDIINSKIYWNDGGTGKIQKANLDGSNVEDVVTGINSTYFMALDPINSKIYWTGFDAHKIERANLDGSNVEDVVTGLDEPFDITLDIANSKIYWTEADNNKIQRCNFDGTNVEDLVTGLSEPGAIVLGVPDIALSVELASFSARQIENSIQLNWSTASETENEGFNIYRKISGSEFVQIASYKSHRELRGQGNTSVETNYTFTDNSKLQNNEFYTYVISDVETNGLETKHEENSQSVFFEIKTQAVKRFELAQNFPNPFNPSTTISYQLAKDTRVSLKIYNEKGEFVKELTNGFQHEGSHNAAWDGTDENGKSVSSGTYFYKLQAGTFTQTNKMILLK
ncbi:MAG: T9SS C-terminal target domain-containing protein [Calditrichaeota bacterium]|nr:MAG: T9SS C-terminal target domain-containing protein [Calditrichota bacterium]